MKIKLSEIIPENARNVSGPIDAEIKGITYDSRMVKKGYVFVALPGKHVNGKRFIENAVDSGAAAVVSSERADVKGAALIVAEDPLSAMAEMASKIYGRPDGKLLLIGITGTNGKTTISYFLESIFSKAGKKPGVTGTINYRYGGKLVPAPNTTPQSADIYRMLGEMAAAGTDTAIMEVSSHALALERVRGIEFDIGIFTNLTRDHLDFHKTMDEYFKAKSKLFTGLGKGSKVYNKTAVINIDDPWGEKLRALTRGAKVITYGLDKEADFSAVEIKITSTDTKFILKTPGAKKNVRLSLLGKHNVYNALAAAAAAVSGGIPLEKVIEGLESLRSVPGRLERVDSNLPFTVVVDYAHTDDALKNVLEAMHKIEHKKIITVFGCGGDRDRTKRPLMGNIGAALSSFVFVTSDNPRSENPENIALEIEEGIRETRKNNYEVIIDRERAIAAAVKMAGKGDIVLIAGKGHETYQIIGDERIHFNDAEIALKYMKKREQGNY